jgi:hypothetical protein
MKKLLFGILLFSIGSSLMAQIGLHIAVLGGPQNTWILNDQPINPERGGFKYKLTFGWAGMVKIGYNFVPPIGIHIGLGYSTQGQKFTSIDSNNVAIATYRELTYWKIPLLLRMTSDPGPVMFVMELGPQVSVLRRAEILDDNNLQTYVYPNETPLKNIEVGVAWSLGAEFSLAKGLHLVIQQRGDYGIGDVENKTFSENGQAAYAAGRHKAHSATFSVLAGLNYIPKRIRSKTTRHYKGKTWHNNWR